MKFVALLIGSILILLLAAAAMSARGADIFTPLVPVQLAPRVDMVGDGTLSLKDVVPPPVIKLPEPTFINYAAHTWSSVPYDVTLSEAFVMEGPVVTLSKDTISISSDKGEIVIDLNTGSVKLPKDMRPNEAGSQFWKAVTVMRRYLDKQTPR